MIELVLPTMTCGHCVKTVTATVQKLDAAARVQIASTQPAEVLKKALAEEGYPAQ